MNKQTDRAIRPRRKRGDVHFVQPRVAGGSFKVRPSSGALLRLQPSHSGSYLEIEVLAADTGESVVAIGKPLYGVLEEAKGVPQGQVQFAFPAKALRESGGDFRLGHYVVRVDEFDANCEPIGRCDLLVNFGAYMARNLTPEGA